ncbi:MAG: flavodoxin family protein [Clostridia bacterium]|nr:flavodoxin family protein [Lachnospiraceae bacterium]NCC00686.1 flavodoxin family protein [Clostridia bacterium]NCD02699.1 flavodoxin family protein [Clostridia bacterium]
MKIIVITGSPHRSGTTAALAEQFSIGAAGAGHQVCRFDAAFKNVHPCIACEKCHTTEDGCAFKDDMEDLNPKLLEADAVVFVSPIYYYDINAQIKAVIDRFYANDAVLHGHKKAALILAMADDTIESADGAVASFKSMTKFLEWDIAGTLIGVNCGDVEALKKTDYLTQAYELGKNM